jgi:hypothetical protein
MPSSQTSPLSLRDLRRKSLIQKLEKRPEVEMLQYGNITLIHKKLDSWIDSKPDLETFTCWTDDHQMMKLEHDHLKCRKQRLSKQRGKLARSWSGNIHLIQRDSMIDIAPKAATMASFKKRTKPRRVSSHEAVLKQNAVRPKDVLLDGDIQAVRKATLEKKLSTRPMLPNAQDYQEELLNEIKLRQSRQPQKSINAKPCPSRIVRRHMSLDRAISPPRALIMPQSA